MRAVSSTLALAALGAGLAACSGGGGSPATPIRANTGATNPSGGSSTASSSTFAYKSAFVQSSQLLGPATIGGMSVDVVLRMSNPAGLISYAAGVSKPGSAVYRHFLTPAQIADKFGASVADQNSAIAYFKSFGLSTGTWQQRQLLRVAGSLSQLQAAFHTTFGRYKSPQGETFYAPEKQPALGANVPVIGSADIVYRPIESKRQFVPAKGVGTGYAPQQIASAFDYTGAYNSGYTGAGITIGIIGTGPIQVQTSTTVGDANAYRSLYSVAGASTVTEVSTPAGQAFVDGSGTFATPPPVAISGCNSTQTNPGDGLPASDSPYTNCNPEDIEAQIDTEQSSMLARDANVQFYLAYSPNAYCNDSSIAYGSPCPAADQFPAQGLALQEEESATLINNDTADVVSGSFGESEEFAEGPQSPPYAFTDNAGVISGLDPMQYADMVSEGMAVFISSGDQGANECQGTGPANEVDDLCVAYPAVDPSVVGVGGVTTPLNSAGQIAGPITAWGVQTSGGASGTGGGVSDYFPQPSFQAGLPGIMGTTRNSPDVSLEADDSTGVAVLAYADPSFGGAELEPVGGTSVAAPEMAAMWATVLQACKATSSCATASGSYPYRLGNPNPLFYGVYGSATKYPVTFLPVEYGDNSMLIYCAQTNSCPSGTAATLDPGYSANASGGYNQLTGLGVPFGRALIRAVVGI